MTGKFALCATLSLIASVCHAGDSVRLDLWHTVDAKASFQGTFVLPCRPDDLDPDVKTLICSNNESVAPESDAPAQNYFWISLRGNAMAYWIRYHGSQIVEFGADAKAYAEPATSPQPADSMHRFAITLP